jgi:Holliday junction resolvasome RuvABC ATP-dependent DNA helicase subunit
MPLFKLCLWFWYLFYEQNVLPANTSGVQINISVTQMPNSSPIFTGRQDVLDKLEKIFIHQVSNRLLRHSCLLWGMGGIGKTQICLKFIEEMSRK